MCIRDRLSQRDLAVTLYVTWNHVNCNYHDLKPDSLQIGTVGYINPAPGYCRWMSDVCLASVKWVEGWQTLVPSNMIIYFHSAAQWVSVRTFRLHLSMTLNVAKLETCLPAFLVMTTSLSRDVHRVSQKSRPQTLLNISWPTLSLSEPNFAQQ